MSNKTLMPPNSTRLEMAVEQSIIESNEVPIKIRDVFDPYGCPPELLPFLAWAESISYEEGWDFSESDELKRNLISRSAEIHKKKGTVWAVREVFRILGLGEIQILENVGRLRRDGSFRYDGQMLHGGDASSTWATYIIKLFKPITNDQVETIKRLLDGIAPARSELVRLDYTEAAIRHNGRSRRDGTYNYGAAT